MTRSDHSTGTVSAWKFIQAMSAESHQYNLSHTVTVLGVPEILSLTLSYASRCTLANCARVCKFWTDPALDELWKEVYNPIHAFQLLAPLKLDKESRSQKFTRRITTKDWSRFQFYAKRIRSLTYMYNDWRETGEQKLHHSSLQEIARARLDTPIFSNLKHLDLGVDTLSPTQMPLILLRKDLQSLSLSFSNLAFVDDSSSDSEDELPTPRYANFFVELQNRAPELTCLTLRINPSIPRVKTHVIKYLTSLPLLEKLDIPPSSCANDILTTLAKLSNLHTIEFASWLDTHQLGLAPGSKETQFHPELREGAFPVLRNLSLNAAFDDISKFFPQSFAPTNISHLCITSEYLKPETAESFASCLRVLVDSCQSLVSLGFGMGRGINFDMAREHDASYQIETRISYQEFAILKGLPGLKNFEFSHKDPISLTNEELGNLVSSWASLETLCLTVTDSNFHTTTSSTLTLACLLPLAQYCPNLRKLDLYMDATVPVCLPKVFKPFKRLEELHVGASPIEDVVSVSVFLSGLCPIEVQLERRESIRCFMVTEAEYYTHDRDRKFWRRVPNVISLLQKLRSEENEYSDVLRRKQRDIWDRRFEPDPPGEYWLASP